LIHDLSTQSRPVRRIEKPLFGLLRWTALSAVCVAGGILAFGLRPDLDTAAANPTFPLLAVLTLAVGGAATWSALRTGVPGMDTRLLRALPGAILSLAVAVLLGALLSANGGVAGIGMTCVERIFAVVLLPGALILNALRKAAPLAARRAGMLAALSAFAPGVFAIQFICRHDDPLHILVWHFTPFAFMLSIGASIGRTWLASWDER